MQDKFLFSGVTTQPLFHLPLEGEVARHRRDGGGALVQNVSRYKRFYHHSSFPTAPHPPQAVPLPLKGKVKILVR